MADNINKSGFDRLAYGSGTAGATLKSTGTGTNADPIIPTVQLAATPTIDIGQVQLLPSGTGTPASVASSASAVTLLAANASRLGATCFNDSTQVLYLILSTTTPTSSVYTVQIAASGYYEVPYQYQGIIKGIWASANGFARMSELVA